MGKKKKDKRESQKKVKNVFGSVAMEDREGLYDKGLAESPMLSDKFIRRRYEDVSEEFSGFEKTAGDSMELSSSISEELKAQGASPAAPQQLFFGAGQSPANGLKDAQARAIGRSNGNELKSRHDILYKDPEIAKRVEALPSWAKASFAPTFEKSSKVGYRQKDGTVVEVEIVAVDMGVLPYAYTIRLPSGTERETEAERLSHLESSALSTQIPAPLLFDPAERFYDKALGGIIHPILLRMGWASRKAAPGFREMVRPQDLGKLRDEESDHDEGEEEASELSVEEMQESEASPEPQDPFADVDDRFLPEKLAKIEAQASAAKATSAEASGFDQQKHLESLIDYTIDMRDEMRETRRKLKEIDRSKFGPQKEEESLRRSLAAGRSDHRFRRWGR
mmetsp:Transcript_10742/g.16842  ORF Transcript_10742/g.16842 Transcript_10742/m.16842 type:complete len:393 (+) Transcript_10742:3-1181(+)